jgi:hypothetical protein
VKCRKRYDHAKPQGDYLQWIHWEAPRKPKRGAGYREDRNGRQQKEKPETELKLSPIGFG